MKRSNKKSGRQNPFRTIYQNPAFALAKERGPASFPLIIDVELTNACNLSCIFCARQSMVRPQGVMSEKLFEKILAELAEHHSALRIIGWGEPLLHPKAIEFCQQTKKSGVPVHMTTNGLLLDDEKMKRLIELEVDSLIFSFQGATKEEYARFRANDQFIALQENVLKMVELRGGREKPFITITSTMTDESKERVEEFVSYWASVVDEVCVGRTNLFVSDVKPIISEEVKKKIEELRLKSSIKKVLRPCMEVYQKLGVFWDGKVTCCCTDFDDLLIVGDANTENLFQVWNHSAQLKRYREMIEGSMRQSLPLCRACYHTYDEF